ncbi:MAG: hypothetical protein ACOC38_05525 [Promethearchaeia archaeon]
MPNETKIQLDNLLNRAKALLEGYNESKSVLKTPSTQANEIALSEVARHLVGSVFSKGAGIQARKFSREILEQNRKTKLKELKTRSLQQVEDWIKRVVRFLKSVSTDGAQKPNSSKLVSKFLRIQEYVNPDTRLKHGITILKKFNLKGIVSNEKLAQSSGEGLVARPGEQFKAYRRILEIASKAKGYLFIVDPYPGQETLVVLEKSPLDQPARLLTFPLRNKSKRAEFETLAKKLTRDRPKTEVRYAPRGMLHDRFIITENQIWHVGHSIKDIGNKLSAITPMRENKGREAKRESEKIWKKSSPI